MNRSSPKKSEKGKSSRRDISGRGPSGSPFIGPFGIKGSLVKKGSFRKSSSSRHSNSNCFECEEKKI